MESQAGAAGDVHWGCGMAEGAVEVFEMSVGRKA